MDDSEVPRLVCNGRYRLLEPIGRGATSDVYAAEDTHAGDRRVAIKFLKPHLVAEEDVVARFQREAKIASAIDSPYIARFHNAGKDRQGRVWLVFELLAGRSLDAILREEGTLPFAFVVRIVEDVLLGLMAIHEKGIIHRDIKPGNLFVEERADGTRGVRLLDFGVSKLWATAPDGTPQSVLTVLGALLGTPNYMPPEQVVDPTQVTERSDVYAVGCVAFRALTGQLPFVGDTPEAVLTWKQRFRLFRLGDVTPERWPESLEALLERAMARDPADRFASAGAMLEELRAITPVVLEELGERALQASSTARSGGAEGDTTSRA